MRITLNRPIWFALTSIFVITACTTNPPMPSDEAPVRSSIEHTANTDTLPVKPLTGETLFQLLLAEIAINRDEFGVAANLYSQLALREPDIGVLERGVALNQSIRNYQQSSSLAQLWVSKDVNSEAAWRALAITSLANQDTQQTAEALRSWLLINPEADVTLLSNGLSSLSAEDQTRILETVRPLTDQYPQSHQLRYIAAQLSSQAGDFNTAQQYISAAIQLNGSVSYRLFQYQLLIATDDIPAATTLITELYQENDGDQQLAVQYARHLFRYQRDDIATLQALHSQNSHEPIIARTFARAAFENGEFDLAEGVFIHLSEQGFADESFYFLGLISLENQLPSSAIGYFSQVRNPPYLASALIEWLQIAEVESIEDLKAALDNALLVDPELFETYWRIKGAVAQQFESKYAAFEVFQSALDLHPNHSAFLYEQALIGAYINRYDVLENNLTQILIQEPNNANALNALGYTWADLNKNLEQAQEYIDRALAQEPENPAFLDSKGWVLYRLGNHEAALGYLLRAFDQLQVDEVAAHIAEVYWVLGRKSEAKEYLEKVRQLDAESRFLAPLEELIRD